MGRLALSMFEDTEVLLQIFTDAPKAAVAGTADERDDLMACLLVLWLVLGAGVAFHKASRGRDNIWIGARFVFVPGGLQVTVKQDLLDELQAMIMNSLSLNRVTLQLVRCMAGKANHVAGLVHA